MSVNDEFIKVTPPEFIGSGHMKESFTSSGHRCGYCHGTGFFWGAEKGEPVKTGCPACNGSGKLDAVVTIEWKPSKKQSR